MVTVARCLISHELAPTITSNSPLATAHECVSTSQMLKSRGASVNALVDSKRSVAPGARTMVFLKPFSCFGGSPASGGNRR